MSDFYAPNVDSADPEALTMCPYNAEHMIRKSRMPYHLTKCRASHPCAEMQRCPYNATHVYPKVEHQYHLTHCENRSVVERDIIYNRPGGDFSSLQYSGNCTLPSYNTQHVECSENWDQDEHQYDSWPTDRMYMANQGRLPKVEPVILENVPPADIQRKLAERQKLQQMSASGIYEAATQPPVIQNSAPISQYTASMGFGRGVAISNRDLVSCQDGSGAVDRERAERMRLRQLNRRVTVTPAFSLPAAGRGSQAVGRGVNRPQL